MAEKEKDKNKKGKKKDALLTNPAEEKYDAEKAAQIQRWKDQGPMDAWKLAGDEAWNPGEKDYSSLGKWPYQAPVYEKPKSAAAGKAGESASRKTTGSTDQIRSSGGGTGDGSSSTSSSSTSGYTPDQENRDLLYGDADQAYLQRQYDKYRNLEDPNRFQFDDTYAPDSEGFRDVGGYAADFGKVALGAFGATKKLDPYQRSGDFTNMVNESRNRRDMGLTAESRSAMVSGNERGYAYDVKNIRNMAGGSGGAALANLGGASDRFYQNQSQMNALDEQLKMANREQYYQIAGMEEGVNHQIWQDQRQIDLIIRKRPVV